MLIAVVACFALAAVAWPVHRLLGRHAGPVLALAPALLLAGLYLRHPWLGFGDVASAADSFTTPLLQSIPWVPALDIPLAFRLDGLSLLFATLILGIGALVFAYAGGYMAKHGGGGRFFPVLAAFMGSMLGLVLADNLIVMFIFWEMTSITSFLLIGFDFQKEKARAAALQALLVTGLGGLALLAGALLLGHAAGSLSISSILASPIDLTAHPLYTGIVLTLVLAAFTKSAQWPFHFWLPTAMVAPTPVSTYLHSATMVKAGVYLLARFQHPLGGTLLWDGLLIGAGLATLLTGSVMAVAQTDLKRLLAYATVGALGTMVLLIGLGSDYALAALPVYILAHGLYKAALFLVAGIVDMKTGTRDIRQLGGLLRKMPVTFAAALLAGISFAGLPPAAGYLAKELLYKAGSDHHFGLGAVALSAALVLAKSLLFAVAVLVAVKPFAGGKTRHTIYAKDAPLFMSLGPVLLGALGFASGWLGSTVLAPLLKPAAAAVAGHAVKQDLSLWHGFVPAFWLSLATVAFGVVALLFTGPFRGWRDRLAPLAPWGPDGAYHGALRMMFAVGHRQTAIVQNGRLRHYVLTVIVALLLLAGGTFWVHGGFGRVELNSGGIRIYEILLAAVTLAGALGTALARSRLMAVTTLGTAGFGVALLFLVFSGPDLSATQFAVETLGVILFVFVLYKMPAFRPLGRTFTAWRDAIVALLTGGFVTLLVLAAYGDAPLSRLGAYFAESSYLEGKGKNVVNVILVDFRALDTLGEITVIAIAAIGVYALMRVRRHDDDTGVAPQNRPDGTVQEDLEAQR